MAMIEGIALFVPAYACLWMAMVAYVAHLVRGDEYIGRMGTGINGVGGSLWVMGLILRAVQTGRWPVASLYEICLLFTSLTVAFYLLLERLAGTRAAGPFVLLIALLVGSYALLLIPPSARLATPLEPALRGLWFPIHALATTLAYSAFAVACGFGLLRLCGEGLRARGLPFPSPEAVDELNSRAVAFGFPFLALGLVAGAWGAQIHLGRYWNWGAKEAWTLVIGLIYAAFLHARATGDWSGRCLAFVSVLGFVVVLLVLLGTGEPADWLK